MILRNGNFTLFVSQLGATVTGFQHKGEHVIFPQQMIVINGNLKLRGGVPILFPWFGSREDLPQHGFLRDTVMTKTEVLSPVEGIYALDYSRNKFFYEHRFLLSVYFSITPTGYMQQLQVSHMGDSEPMPVNPGFHPYFAMPKHNAKVEFPNEETSIDITEEKFERGKGMVLEMSANPAVIHLDGLGRVTITAGDCSTTVVWTDSFRYICVEPVFKPLDEYEKTLLYPGEVLDLELEVAFEPEG